MNPIRLAVLFDFAEEGWPSMDLCARMLVTGLQRDHADRFDTRGVVPTYHRRFERLRGFGRNPDRLINRMWDYPRQLRKARGRFDLFHLVDHSYCQLVHGLPRGRVGVYCHDLDTFRCLLEPQKDRRARWFRAMTRRILRGMEKADVIFHSTMVIRDEILRHHLADPATLVWAPLGACPAFTPDDPATDRAEDESISGRYILHVGSGIPRKRLDVLLNVFAETREAHPELRLVQVGANWSDGHLEIIHRRDLERSIVHLVGLPQSRIASLYRHASVVLQTSDAEGFGLPVIEAMACGAPVLASGIPVLREIGGAAARYAPSGDVEAWSRALADMLRDDGGEPARRARLEQAGQFTWENHCRIVAGAYQRLPAPAVGGGQP